MTDISMIPLTKLVPDTENVRKQVDKTGIAELAASIKHHGLLQSLVVRSIGAKFAVVAGGRRLRALKQLVKAGDFAKDASIPCRVTTDENAAELSLAENTVRKDMAVHEELEAFRKLADGGFGPETIAARFGVSGLHVARRLRLARVSPKLLEALKREEANLEQISALAFTDDHAAQERAFFEAPEWSRTPDRLKAHVTQAHVPDTDKLAVFVGLDAYRSAGGVIVSDLFAEDDDTTSYLADRPLLNTLAEAKLEALAGEVRNEGWAWVQINLDGIAWTQYPQRIREKRRALTDDENAEQERLYAKLDETDDEAEIEKIEAAIDALAPASWNSAEVAIAGALVTLTHDGEPKVERGLVRVDAVKALKALNKGAQQTDEYEHGQDGLVGATGAKPALPAKLVDELLAHKSLALRTELANQPLLSLKLTVFALALPFVGARTGSCLGIALKTADIGRYITHATSKADKGYEAAAGAWRDQLPGDAVALWEFLAKADITALLDLLAVIVATGIDLVTKSNEPVLNEALVAAANLDMSKYWQATPKSYFEHIRKDVIIDAIAEQMPDLDRAKLAKAPKAELITRAKRLFKGSSWLPAPLRAEVGTLAAEHSIAAE
ncbi:MAG: ParB/RepB/Spo0J family partition protein [Hyphomonadaceae bacterium]|nr:ParB/RepB/Spo0J family partition protein [Hyphomonadaceae bacterium]